MASTIPKPKAGADGRIAELEAELARERRAVRDQKLLYSIAALAVATDDMDSFYNGVHDILRELLYADNCYVALYEEDRRLLNYPYYIDTVDTQIPDPRAWVAMGEEYARGATAYILRTGKTLHQKADLRRLLKEGEVVYEGAVAVDYIGVPLKTGGQTVGVLAVQSYIEGTTYDRDDVALLEFAAGHIAAALQRTRSDAELRQRNAELAIVNEVGQALAKQLDLDAIAELVGERLFATFPDVGGLFVALYDASTNMISFPYEVAEGQRYHTKSIPAKDGLTARVIKTGQPVWTKTAAEGEALGAIPVPDTPPTESWLGVPIVGGDELIGVVALEAEAPYSFDEDDLRLVSTLAASTGVALRNARLFDQTNVLLAQTQQRNAELAVINEIGAALGKHLDFQGIVDAVGDRLTQVLETGDLAIAIVDESANVITFPYAIENGLKVEDTPPIAIGEGLTSKVLASKQPLRLGTVAAA
jgi:GAF domain-containing protein